MWWLLDFCDCLALADEEDLCMFVYHGLTPVITDLFLNIIALICDSLAKIAGMFLKLFFERKRSTW